MKHLHQRQKIILEYLLNKSEGATVEALCEVAGVTKTAVKGHLSQLESFGYVFAEDRKLGVGRPLKIYTLAPAGEEVFPRRYAWLSHNLMEMISEKLTATQLDELLKDLAQKTASPLLESLKNLNTQERLRAIVKVMNDLGYRAQFRVQKKTKDILVEATNCVYHSTAMTHPQLCQFDIYFLKTTSRLDVELQECMAKGGSSCRFCLKQK